MNDTRHPTQILHASQADFEAVESLLLASSDAEAVLSLMLLRDDLPEPALVALANMREVLRSMPVAPFIAADLTNLQQLLSYEPTRRSYRKLFDDEGGVFGLEFVGQGKLIEAIVVLTATSRCVLTGAACDLGDGSMIEILVNHQVLSTELSAALRVLGHPIQPKQHTTIADFIAEYGAATASEAFGELF